MQKTFKSFLLLLLPLVSIGQQELLFLQKDTIKFESRVGGVHLDSIDLYFTPTTQLNPGGTLYNPLGTENQFLSILSYTNGPFVKIKPQKNYYAALPHLGFLYSFGSKGAQFLQAEYQQQLGRKTSFSFQMQQNALGEMMRHGDFTNRDVQMHIEHAGRRYIGKYDLWYQSSEISHNNGLIDTVSANEFPLTFLAVNNEQAHSKINQAQFISQHVFNMSKDSLRIIGPVYKNSWTLSNRIFRDSLDMLNKYDSFLIDSFTTRDQFQLAEVQNAFGIYAKGQRFSSEILMQASYWDYQNLGRNLDTTELEIHLNSQWSNKGVTFQNRAKLNLVGAIGEWEESINLSLISKNNSFSFQGKFLSELPSPYQRRYMANSSIWKLSNLKPQRSTQIRAQWSLKHRLSPYLSVNYRQFKNRYFYLDNTWRNDTLESIGLLRLEGAISIPFKNLGIQLRSYVNPLANKFEYIPLYDLRARFYFNKKLFKAKKFDFILGLELKYQSEYSLLMYNSSLGIYELQELSNTQRKLSFGEVDIFTGFQIDEFRFYFKLENLDYSWIDHDIEILSAYPLTPLMMRIGITWDFFN